MTDEDHTAARLKGFNVLVKFIDGEELLVTVPFLDTDDDVMEWMTNVDQFLNGSKEFTHMDIPRIAANRQLIKYIKLL
jgi:hypothetical protein